MALPASLSTATITGTYVDLSGNPVRGSISFTPQTIIKELALNVIIIPTIIQETFDANGSFSLTLPCTNDPDVTPEPFVYVLEENFTGGRSFGIALPISIAGTTVNLADLLPALPASDAANYVSIDQYTTLLGRYTTANGIRVIVVDAEDYEGNAQLYAEQTAEATSDVVNASPRAIMMMGV
jgi:hypothetical protein